MENFKQKAIAAYQEQKQQKTPFSFDSPEDLLRASIQQLEEFAEEALPIDNPMIEEDGAVTRLCFFVNNCKLSIRLPLKEKAQNIEALIGDKEEFFFPNSREGILALFGYVYQIPNQEDVLAEAVRVYGSGAVREFVGLALNGLCSNSELAFESEEKIARHAIIQALAVLKRLNAGIIAASKDDDSEAEQLAELESFFAPEGN